MQTYHEPPVTGDVHSLIPESAGNAAVLTPETIVLFIHRGRHILRDKFDGRDYVIVPGYHRGPYGLAKHFQDRAVIAGTRNPEQNTQQSYIGILKEVDGVEVGLEGESILPLTDAEVERFGAAVEAIDRQALTSDVDRGVTTVRTNTVQATSRAGLQVAAFTGDGQATDDAQRAADGVLVPPDTTLAMQDAAEAGQVGANHEPVSRGGSRLADVARKIRG